MPTQIQIQTEKKTAGAKQYVSISLDGQIDESNLADFSSVVDPLIGGGEQVFVSISPSWSSSTVKSSVTSRPLTVVCPKTSQQMLFAAPNQNILDILELVGLTQIVPTFESEEKAAAAIEQGEI